MRAALHRALQLACMAHLRRTCGARCRAPAPPFASENTARIAPWAARHLRLSSSGRQSTRRPAGGDGAPGGGFVTLEGETRNEIEVKKSRFLAAAWPVGSPDEALARIAAASDPGASHNCWAYRIGQQYRSSDDGEPGGTAGRPILAAIEGENLDGTAVLVVRYFGGTKLGAGGLMRSYGQAARECLRAAPKREVLPKLTVEMEVPFELLGSVYRLVEQYGAEKQREGYDAGDAVSLRLGVLADRAAALQAAVREATGGRVAPTLLQADPSPD